MEEPVRSLREVRKQYKERALAAANMPTATPQPSPPISEADFQSSASVNAFNDAQSVTGYEEEIKKDTEKKFGEWLQQSKNLFLKKNEPGAVGTPRWMPPGMGRQKCHFCEKEMKK